MMNHLEQLVGEWYEYNGYFVRRNVLVGKRLKGGYECELDVVAFNPRIQHLVHIEPSLDAASWAKRAVRYSKKFEAGRRYIPEMFSGVALPSEIEQIALLVFASDVNITMLGGGRVALASDFYAEIVKCLRGKRVYAQAVPEQFPLLRTIQYCCEYEVKLFGRGTSSKPSNAIDQRVPFVRGW
jgi:hypothetical protein